MRRWLALWFSGPRSLMQMAAERRARKRSNLYVLRVDFPVSREKVAVIDEALDPLRKKYGLDFIVLEPGIHLSRFDDI